MTADITEALPWNDSFKQPGSAELARLGALIQAHAPYDGVFDLRLPGVRVTRSAKVYKELVHSVQTPALCVVAQGAKSVLLGPDVYEYNPTTMLVYSVNLPVATRVTQASLERPFLTFKLDLEPQRIAELSLKVFPHGLPKGHENRGVYISASSASIVHAATRLVELMTNEREALLIGPLIVDEILMRLLLSPIGSRVAQLGHLDSNVQRVAKAIDWVREHFDQSLQVEILADMVNMGVSTFHAHFKAVTSMSPLQFQKTLRLQEARRLMTASSMDAGTAGRHVGYASASQFSREYSRLFGNAPTKDMARLREHGPLPNQSGI